MSYISVSAIQKRWSGRKSPFLAKSVQKLKIKNGLFSKKVLF